MSTLGRVHPSISSRIAFLSICCGGVHGGVTVRFLGKSNWFRSFVWWSHLSFMMVLTSLQGLFSDCPIIEAAFLILFVLISFKSIEEYETFRTQVELGMILVEEGKSFATTLLCSILFRSFGWPSRSACEVFSIALASPMS